MLDSKPCILFAGGGTGGHIAPLLAVMEQVHALAPEIGLAYVGTAEDLRSPLIRSSTLPFVPHAIPAGKLHRFATADQFRQFGRMFSGLTAAHRLMRALAPAAVFSKGGMVGVPVAMAASRRKVPVYGHESDAAPGLANRLVGRFSDTIFTSFPVAHYKTLPAEKLVYAGQPVRTSFRKPLAWSSLAIGERELLRAGDPILTVTGGSQGSHQINAMVSSMWGELLERVRIVQITGGRDFQELRMMAANLPARLRDRLYLTEFLAEGMPELVTGSSLAVSRASSTIFELAAARMPSILVPLPGAAQDHQRLNAGILERSGAAIVLDRESATPERLLGSVTDVLDSADRRRQLAEAIGTFDRPDASRTMAEALIAAAGAKRGNKVEQEV